MTGLLGPALTGFVLGGSLIVAIGAQNAFILRIGLLSRHVFVLCLVCSLADALLIAAGIAGMGAFVQAAPQLLAAITWGGALFLFGYALFSARRALYPQVLQPDAGGVRGLWPALAQCLAFTFLNPHVYLDTVVLVGAYSTTHVGAARLAFAIGAMLASFAWFFALGYGARFAAPIFARPSAWRMLDGAIAVVMAVLGVSLLVALHH